MKTLIKITIDKNIYEVNSTYEMNGLAIIDVIKGVVESNNLIIDKKLNG